MWRGSCGKIKAGFFLWFIILHFLPMLPVEGFQHTEVWAVVQEVKILTHDDIITRNTTVLSLVTSRRCYTIAADVQVKQV
ncbi:hypothetical protein NQZ68_002256 [Dissostichus eleginoides]|nr:hypothetical protein NQZ68_002256 [Dissostichus eleginoides]